MTRPRTGMDPRRGLNDTVGENFHMMPRDGRAMDHRVTRREIAEEAASEARDREDRFILAGRIGTVTRPIRTRPIGDREREVIDAARREARENLVYADSGVCPFCEVRSIYHAELGCKRWSPEQ